MAQEAHAWPRGGVALCGGGGGERVLKRPGDGVLMCCSGAMVWRGCACDVSCEPICAFNCSCFNLACFWFAAMLRLCVRA